MSTRPHRTTRSSAAAAQAAPPAPTTTRSRKPSTVEAPSTASTTTTATRKVPLPWNSSAAPDTKTTRTAATKPAARPLWNQTKLNSTTDASSSNTPQRRPNSALSNNKTLNNGTPTLTKQSSNAMLAPPTERKRTLSTASIDSVVEPPTPNFRAVDGEKQGMENYDPAREPIKAYLRVRPPPAGSSAENYIQVVNESEVLMVPPADHRLNPSASSMFGTLLRSSTMPLNPASHPSTPDDAAPCPTPASPTPFGTVYKFTSVFAPTADKVETSQADFFKETTLPLVHDFLDGHNCLLFAYGPTGSGKTFTVQGQEGAKAGLLPRVMDVVWRSLEGKESKSNLRPTRLTGVEMSPPTERASRIPMTSTPTKTFAQTPAGQGLGAKSSMLRDIHKSLANTTDALPETFPVDDNYEYSIWVSYAEIYLEKIYDLLEAPTPVVSVSTSSTTSTSSSIFQSGFGFFGAGAKAKQMVKNLQTVKRNALSLKHDKTSGNKYVHGMKEVRVHSAEEARTILARGQANRSVFGTGANSESSRSHSVFTIKIVKIRKGANPEDPNAATTSRFSIVDLAGSERANNTGAVDDRLKEAGQINKSLMVLGQCMEVLRRNQEKGKGKKPAIVPFRHSKLTELFQSFFVGDGKAAMIVNVNPYDTSFDENSHVMKFSAVAKGIMTIKNNVRVTVPAPVTLAVKEPRIVRLSLVEGGEEEDVLCEDEEEEDDGDDEEDEFVNALLEELSNLRKALFESQMHAVMIESQTRTATVQQYERKFLQLEQQYQERMREEAVEAEIKLNAKLDILTRLQASQRQSLGTNASYDDSDEEEEEEVSFESQESQEASVEVQKMLVDGEEEGDESILAETVGSPSPLAAVRHNRPAPIDASPTPKSPVEIVVDAAQDDDEEDELDDEEEEEEEESEANLSMEVPLHESSIEEENEQESSFEQEEEEVSDDDYEEPAARTSPVVSKKRTPMGERQLATPDPDVEIVVAVKTTISKATPSKYGEDEAEENRDSLEEFGLDRSIVIRPGSTKGKKPKRKLGGKVKDAEDIELIADAFAPITKSTSPNLASSTTPLLPRELPPFQLCPLVSPVFSLSAPSLPASPVKGGTATTPGSPPLGSRSRLGQLVSTVAGGAGASAGAGGDSLKLASVRSVEAGDDHVWVGGSDGRVRIYEVGEGLKEMPGLGTWSPRSASPASGGRRTPTSPSLREVSALDHIEDVLTPSRKAADRIAVLKRLDKAVVLSEGVLTFHSLTSLTPLSVHAFPSVRGVTTFALDEDELAGRGSPEVMHLVAIKRRTIQLLRITNQGVSTVKDLPLPGALLVVLRRGHVCIADTENYSIVDLEAAVALPLLPISQSPIEDESSLDPDASMTATPSGINPLQRPAVACVGNSEFLIASHTGATTIGVFVTEGGEPCRGTLEWASNLRSLVVDPLYSIALLHNNTLEIHSLHTQAIVQVIPLPSSSSPLALQPRSLTYSWTGLDLGAATGGNKVEPVTVRLLPAPATPSWPTTPTKASRSSISSARDEDGKGKGTLTKTLIVGKNSLYGLTPLTLVAQADAMMDKGRVEEALGLAEQIEKAGSGGVRENPELAYVYLRGAYIALGKTLFQDAFNLFLKAQADPRLVVRMFPNLRDPLISANDETFVCRGVQNEVQEAKSVDDFILANLNRNYSPHLKPDVETAAPTMELRMMLGTTARDCLTGYLTKWREARRSGTGFAAGDDSRKVDMVVDTTLVRLLAEEKRPKDIEALLDGPNDCVLPQVEPTLREAGLYELLSSILLKRGEVRKTLDIWTKIVEGEYVDPEFENGVQRIFDLVWKTKEKDLVERYGLWLIPHDRALGLKLFNDPKQTITFETRELFTKISAVDSAAADSYLEGAVLQERDSDSRLHVELVKRYIDRLGELLADTGTKAHLRDQESAYATLISQSSSCPSFLSFLISSYSAEAEHAQFDLVRLKTILFLRTSSKYDVAGTKKDLEEMEVKGLRGLTLERAIVYGRLRLDRQALALLLQSLQDLTSAEVYCQQSGDPLVAADVTAATTLLALPPVKRPSRKSQARKEAEQDRKASLARLLVEMCLVGKGEEEQDVSKADQVARILETQAGHLDPIEVLPMIPSQWPLTVVNSYLSGTLRRSLHARQEASLLKAIALSQNMAITERLGDLQLSMGGTVELDDGTNRRPQADVVQLEKAGEKVEEKGYSVGDGGEVDELDLR